MVVHINKQLIIVSNENILDVPIYEEKFSDKINHEDKYSEYALKNNIESTYKNGYEWGRFLAQKGFLNICTASENSILFLPIKLSINQYKWLKKNIRKIVDYKLGIVNFEFKGELKETRFSYRTIDILMKLKEIIEEKIVEDDKYESKKYQLYK